MTSPDLRQLAVTSVADPAAAARSLMALALPRAALWTALLLVAVLNTILFGLSHILVPAPEPVQMAGLFSSPIAYFVLVSGGLVLTIYAIFWTGRLLGGSGALEDVMVLIIWLQGLRVLVQAAALVLLLVLPMLSMLLIFAAALIGLYILLHFVDQAHRLNSLGRSAGVLIASVVAIVVGLSLLLSLIGGPMIGAVPHV